MDRSKTIAELNDAFRRSFQGGEVNSSWKFATLPADTAQKALDAIKNQDSFPADDDPRGEHNFGALTVDGQEIVWKIDYFTDKYPNEELHSDDPADPEKTTRVMTIMLLEEY